MDTRFLTPGRYPAEDPTPQRFAFLVEDAPEGSVLHAGGVRIAWPDGERWDHGCITFAELPRPNKGA